MTNQTDLRSGPGGPTTPARPVDPAPDATRAVTSPAVPEPGAVRRYYWVRVGFGAIWAIDAALKWQPGFRRNVSMMVGTSGHGQPTWLTGWFDFWTHLAAHSPATMAVLIALGETAICLGLLLGAVQRVCFAFGILFSLLIWGVGEGFGGPYTSATTDIGAAIMYAVVFAVLWLAVPRAVRVAAPGLDHRLARYRHWRWATFHPAR